MLQPKDNSKAKEKTTMFPRDGALKQVKASGSQQQRWQCWYASVGEEVSAEQNAIPPMTLAS